MRVLASRTILMAVRVDAAANLVRSVERAASAVVRETLHSQGDVVVALERVAPLLAFQLGGDVGEVGECPLRERCCGALRGIVELLGPLVSRRTGQLVVGAVSHALFAVRGRSVACDPPSAAPGLTGASAAPRCDEMVDGARVARWEAAAMDCLAACARCSEAPLELLPLLVARLADFIALMAPAAAAPNAPPELSADTSDMHPPAVHAAATALAAPSWRSDRRFVFTMDLALGLLEHAAARPGALDRAFALAPSRNQRLAVPFVVPALGALRELPRDVRLALCSWFEARCSWPAGDVVVATVRELQGAPDGDRGAPADRSPPSSQQRAPGDGDGSGSDRAVRAHLEMHARSTATHVQRASASPALAWQANANESVAGAATSELEQLAWPSPAGCFEELWRLFDSLFVAPDAAGRGGVGRLPPAHVPSTVFDAPAAAAAQQAHLLALLYAFFPAAVAERLRTCWRADPLSRALCLAHLQRDPPFALLLLHAELLPHGSGQCMVASRNMPLVDL
jgi:hypothetical protein